jgi:hypothetical protein
LLGSSADPAMGAALDEVLDGRGVDVLFVDGDHRYEGVRADLLGYGPKVAADGLVALHDICLRSHDWGWWTGVGDFWCDLQQGSGGALCEIVDPLGVSIREREPDTSWSWGIGVIDGTKCPDVVAVAQHLAGVGS